MHLLTVCLISVVNKAKFGLERLFWDCISILGCPNIKESEVTILVTDCIQALLQFNFLVSNYFQLPIW